MESFYINVILPLALRSPFTYRVPLEMVDEMIPGKRVVVPFGPKRLYTALIFETDVAPLKGHTPKEIAYVLDSVPVVTSLQLEFWLWVSQYYMCGLGMVMTAALPNAMRLSSQTNLILLDNEIAIDQLDEVDRMVLANLSDEKLTQIEIIEKLGRKSKIQKSIDKLIRLDLVAVDEALKEEVKPRVRYMVKVCNEYLSEKAMSEAMNKLDRAPKQLFVLTKLLELSGFFNGANLSVERKRLMNLTQSTAAIINALESKGIVKTFEEIDDLSTVTSQETMSSLSDTQKAAYNRLNEIWKDRDIALLHGVTGSGKTLVYAEAINEVVKSGGQVLMLVPEIALTTQLVSRLKGMLNADLMVYHSRFSSKERITMWNQALGENPPQVIVGARSSVFLPFKKLQLVVVDEEHEASYKQSEGLPHYNAKDSAMWLAHEHGAKVLLGSATPTVKSTYLSKSGRYGLVELKERYGNQSLPDIEVVDLRKALKERQMKADFAKESAEEIEKTLKAGKQIIIFQNRRGYAPYQICESCGWNAECVNCDVSLTYHRYFEKLLCHYCSYSLKQPTHCPRCASPRLIVKGLGTEKIEDDLEILFLDARIARMDADTTRKKSALQNIITAFEEGAYDILVGTQMVTKGLDFENVGLVVVMNADSLWSRPDYQAFERSFQLLTQVSGRAGRKLDRGKVLIQTYNPEHPVIKSVVHHSYEQMYQTQIQERERYHYPPFTKLVKIQVSHTDAKFNRSAAEFLAAKLRGVFGQRILGPEEPPIARIRNRYLRHIYVKLEKDVSHSKAKLALWQCIDLIEGHKEYKKARVQIDVDP